MGTAPICPSCGRTLAADAPKGLCPECLIKAGFATHAAPEPATPTAATPFIPPSVAELAKDFPQLELLELVGQGGMGAVYRARQPALDRFVALKILPPQLTKLPGFAERFTREARALARLCHPNIVAVHEFGEAGGMPYFIMEFVQGLTLRRLVEQQRLGPREALQIVPQMCEALQYAHDEGVVHRDIKPENILIDNKGRVKIADFGIAKIFGDEPVRQTLTAGKVLGTPHYMAPEQIEHPQIVDHRADIYSLGVVFYEMLTGELPLGRFAPPSRKVQIDVRLDEVVLHALEKEPDLRYQQAGEVKTDIETIARAPAQAPISPSEVPPSSTTTHPLHPRYAHSLRAILTGVLLLLPPLLFTNALLRGYRLPGLDFDADIRGLSGLLGLPLSAGISALLAWAVWLLLPSQTQATRHRSRRWSWLALGSVALLALSLPLAGGAIALLELVREDGSWHPGSGEFVVTVLLAGGALLSATAATLMGFQALRRLRSREGTLRGSLGAFAAAWFWPGFLACFALLWGAQTSITALNARPESEKYETTLVTRGPLKLSLAAHGKLRSSAPGSSQWQIDAWIPETIIAQIELNQKVECRAEAFPSQPFNGKVIEVGNAPETAAGITRYLTVIQPAEPALPFKPGMTVELDFVVAQREDALRIPRQALDFQMPRAADAANASVGLTARKPAMPDGTQGANSKVWVLQAGKSAKPELVPIRIGVANDTWAEVVEGLREGQRVVLGLRPDKTKPLQDPPHTATVVSRYDTPNRPSEPAGQTEQSQAEDVTGVSAEEKRANGDPQMRFFLIGAQAGETPPPAGYPLLLILPGGDGGPDFLTFVKRIYLNALPKGYLVAELIAPQWDETQTQQLTWPTETARYPGMKFSTEAFVEAVVKHLEKEYRLDARRIFTLSWSSGGPAGYAASLYPDTSIRGSLVAMSVFQPQRLPDLKKAQGHAYFLLHSPEDRLIPIGMATRARDSLAEQGARTTLALYEGGHGWHGDVYGNISAGIAWLEEQTTKLTSAAGN